jgi:hypothetical protein
MWVKEESIHDAVVAADLAPYTPARSVVITTVCSPMRPQVYIFASRRGWIKLHGYPCSSSSFAVAAASSIGRVGMQSTMCRSRLSKGFCKAILEEVCVALI